MITPGVAASLTPTSAERPARAEAARTASHRPRLATVLLRIPHPRLQLPHKHA